MPPAALLWIEWNQFTLFAFASAQRADNDGSSSAG